MRIKACRRYPFLAALEMGKALFIGGLQETGPKDLVNLVSRTNDLTCQLIEVHPEWSPLNAVERMSL